MKNELKTQEAKHMNPTTGNTTSKKASELMGQVFKAPKEELTAIDCFEGLDRLDLLTNYGKQELKRLRGERR